MRPGIGDAGCASACADEGVDDVEHQPARRPRACSRRYIRNSVATWSLRERPARSRPPSVGADALDEAALERRVHVLVGLGRREGPRVDVGLEPVEPVEHRRRARRRRAGRPRAAPGRGPASRRGRTARAASRSGWTSTARRGPRRGRRRSGHPTGCGAAGRLRPSVVIGRSPPGGTGMSRVIDDRGDCASLRSAVDDHDRVVAGDGAEHPGEAGVVDAPTRGSWRPPAGCAA